MPSHEVAIRRHALLHRVPDWLSGRSVSLGGAQTVTLLEALKAVAPAVGDGKLIPQQAYVSSHSGILSATNGALWASALVEGESLGHFCVRHAALKQALEREGATASRNIVGDINGLIVRAGRSRVTLKGIDPTSFPDRPNYPGQWVWDLEPNDGEGPSVCSVLRKFIGSSDAHIWQQGVHYMNEFAFAAGPYALVKYPYPLDYTAPQTPLTIPSWAADFISAQDARLSCIVDEDRTLGFRWRGSMTMTSTRLIEEPPDAFVGFASNLQCDGVPVPEGFRETIQRLKAYGLKTFRLAAGKITHVDERMEIEEEIDLDTPPRIWGVDTMLAALEHAERVDLTGDNGKWAGNGYVGVFSGISGGSS